MLILVIQLFVTTFLPQPFDHFPVFIAAGLLALLSFRPILGTGLFAMQGLGIDLFSVIPGFTTVTAVILAYVTYLVLKQIITHQSFYASFIIALTAGILWFTLVYGFALYARVNDSYMIVNETLWVSLLLAIVVSVMQLFGPRFLNRLNRVIRIS
jgi:hypothetical protein